MKSRKKRASKFDTGSTGQTFPKTVAADITRSAIRLTSDCAGIHIKCDRRDCRTQQACLAEGLLKEKIAQCASHWTDHDHGHFWGALRFGILHLCPRMPDGADLEEYRWQEGVEDNPHDVVPVLTFVPRSGVKGL